MYAGWRSQSLCNVMTSTGRVLLRQQDLGRLVRGVLVHRFSYLLGPSLPLFASLRRQDTDRLSSTGRGSDQVSGLDHRWEPKLTTIPLGYFHVAIWKFCHNYLTLTILLLLLLFLECFSVVWSQILRNRIVAAKDRSGWKESKREVRTQNSCLSRGCLSDTFIT